MKKFFIIFCAAITLFASADSFADRRHGGWRHSPHFAHPHHHRHHGWHGRGGWKPHWWAFGGAAILGGFAWYWHETHHPGMWQCVAFEPNGRGWIAIGPDPEIAAYRATMACGDPEVCIVPDGYCRTR